MRNRLYDVKRHLQSIYALYDVFYLYKNFRHSHSLFIRKLLFLVRKKIFLAGNFCNRLAGTSGKAETFVITLLELPGVRKLL